MVYLEKKKYKLIYLLHIIGCNFVRVFNKQTKKKKEIKKDIILNLKTTYLQTVVSIFAFGKKDN